MPYQMLTMIANLSVNFIAKLGMAPIGPKALARFTIPGINPKEERECATAFPA